MAKKTKTKKLTEEKRAKLAANSAAWEKVAGAARALSLLGAANTECRRATGERPIY